MEPQRSHRFPNDVQVRMQRHEMEQQRRMEQLEQARQMNQISPDTVWLWMVHADDYNRQLHLTSFSYLANIMAMRERKRQGAPAYHQYVALPARHATAHTAGTHNGPINGGSQAKTTAHTMASAGKIVYKESAPAGASGAMTKPSAAPIPPSRWKELRQSVRIKATMETEERRVKNARIADLCDEDRDKVTKLIRRIVEIGTLQEESESEFKRQRGVLEAEITELREQVKRDTDEIEELSEKLEATLLKLRDYQERVLLEVEKLRKLVRRQKEEMELKDQDEQRKFKQELERVNQQLKDAQDELLQERRERILEKQKELDERLQKSMASSVAMVSENAQSSLQTATRDTPSSLSIPAAPSMPPPQLDVSSFLNTSMELPEKIKDIMDEWKQRMEVAMAETARNISEQKSVPTGNVETEKALPCNEEASGREEEEEIKKSEKDERNGDLSESCGAEPQSESRRVTQSNRSKPSSARLKEAPEVQRRQFDKYLRIELDSEQDAVNSGGDDRSAQDDSEEEKQADERDEEQANKSPTQRTEQRDRQRRSRHNKAPRSHRKPSHVHMQLRQYERSFEDEAQVLKRDTDSEGEGPGDGDSALVDEINGDSPSFVLMNGFSDYARQGNSPSSLYETSLFDVVDALEDDKAAAFPKAASAANLLNQQQKALRISSPRSQEDHPDSLRRSLAATSAETSSMFRDLLQGMQARERKLARLNGQTGLQQSVSPKQQADGNPRNGLDVDDDFDLFNDVKDLYEQDVLQARQRATIHKPATPRSYLSSATRADHSSFHGNDGESLGPPLSAHDLSLREAIEKDMAELLAEEDFQDLLH
ncbi:hypothetical protein FI667_g14451, partial [Globisporangium splendens]